MQGTTIRAARQAQGLTQCGLAKRLNTTQLSVNRWELGRATPKPETEKRLKDVLGLTDDTIIEVEALLSRLSQLMRNYTNLKNN